MKALTIVACLFLGGCTKRWTAEVHQPPLLLTANDVTRTSLPLAIVVRDMEMGRYQITNSAYYVVVSRDRLRFHITLNHKWDDFADLKTWTVYVEDATGKRHYPEEVSGTVNHISMWRRNGVTYQLHAPMYRGEADVSIYHRDLFAAGKRVTLVLSRADYEYRYRWISGDIEPET
jgi:hypothetical protein